MRTAIEIKKATASSVLPELLGLSPPHLIHPLVEHNLTSTDQGFTVKIYDIFIRAAWNKLKTIRSTVWMEAQQAFMEFYWNGQTQHLMINSTNRLLLHNLILELTKKSIFTTDWCLSQLYSSQSIPMCRFLRVSDGCSGSLRIKCTSQDHNFHNFMNF